jgi:hypothetical protein
MNKSKQGSHWALFALLFLTLAVNVYGQKKPLKNNDFRDIDKFVLVYADSLNKVVLKDSIIPNFLYENNFDLKPLYWESMHTPISLRYLILQKVKSLDVLNFIIDNSDKEKLKILPQTDSPLPFRKYSFYDLIVYRLNELRTKEYYKKFKNEIKAP